MTQVNDALFGLIVVGLVYSVEFNHRPDWVSLRDICESEDATTWFKGNVHQSPTGELVVSFASQKARSRLYRFQAAIGESRLPRRITDDGVRFSLIGEGPVDLERFYVYDYSVDFGPYRSWPPFVGRVFSQLLDYFEVQGDEWAVDGLACELVRPVVMTEMGLTRLDRMRLLFGKNFSLKKIEVSWTKNFKTELSLEEEVIVFIHSSGFFEKFEFDKIPSSISHLTQLFKRLSND